MSEGEEGLHLPPSPHLHHHIHCRLDPLAVRWPHASWARRSSRSSASPAEFACTVSSPTGKPGFALGTDFQADQGWNPGCWEGNAATLLRDFCPVSDRKGNKISWRAWEGYVSSVLYFPGKLLIDEKSGR